MLHRLHPHVHLTLAFASAPTATKVAKAATEEKKNREISVVDSRRAQNCTILLSRLKMTNR